MQDKYFIFGTKLIEKSIKKCKPYANKLQRQSTLGNQSNQSGSSIITTDRLKISQKAPTPLYIYYVFYLFLSYYAKYFSFREYSYCSTHPNSIASSILVIFICTAMIVASITVCFTSPIIIGMNIYIKNILENVRSFRICKRINCARSF